MFNKQVLPRSISYIDANELEYRDVNAVFSTNIDGIGLTIKIRGKTHEVDSIVDIKDALSSEKSTSKPMHAYKFRLEMCCDCCKARSVWYSGEAIFEHGN
jgi:hypothetical protein